MEKGISLGARNGTRIKDSFRHCFYACVQVARSKGVLLHNIDISYFRKSICCFLSKTGHVKLLQFWQMAVKVSFITKFVYFDSLGMKLNVLLKQSPCFLQ